ncbi:hypothetical protein HBI56_175970 [Parastagonospora nodorum]|nr:hypothetical protein HBH53_186140 [Parastagonospora nodorum]KAH3968304.1 hypothetical protein HBH52_179770 [Parastagonospora nodorum]KAH4024684.1 hypothetical protein HBI09_157110 [Parastagonospora nodorum]KAH4045985.1 hypothetical protein HBH49_191930 [Parastagonospora nodorum]KAH4163757.1 hypothetical protein HBH43_154670 [Parastagonospora nodorum]
MPSSERHIQVHDRYSHPLFKFSLPSNLTTLEFHSLLPNSLSPQRPAFTFPALLNWLTRLCANLDRQNEPAHPFHKHPYKLRSLDIQAVDWFWRDMPGKEDKLGFMKLQAEVTTDVYVHEGEEKERSDWLPGAVFLRGGSVGILIVVQPSDATNDDEKHVILTIQPRIAAGSLAFAEIPAGMLDGNSFKGTAANEIAEEAKLVVKESDLINMSELSLPDTDTQENIEAAMYPSPGACDEFIPLFLCQKQLSRKHMEWLKGKATGLRDEGENITLKLVPLDKAWKEGSRDGKTLAALALYQGLKGEGKIPEMPKEVEEEPEELE